MILNKKFIFGFVFLLIVGIFIVGVYARVTSSEMEKYFQEDKKQALVTLYPGWNLVPGLLFVEMGDEFLEYISQSCSEVFPDKSPLNFVYNPFSEEYDDAFKYSLIQEYPDSFYASDYWSSWVYLEEGDSCIVSLDKDYFIDFEKYEKDFKLVKGWNFLSLTTSMIGDGTNDWIGNCNVVSAYAWDAQEERWWDIKDDLKSLSPEGFGMGFIVKVEDDCQLNLKEGYSSDIPSVPEIPNEAENFKDLSSPISAAQIVWNCYHESDSSCLIPITTQTLLDRCAEAGDNNCAGTHKSIRTLLIYMGEFDYSESDLTFEVDSQNETDAIVFVYAPSGEHFPTELYFKKENSKWLYNKVMLS